MNLNLNEFVSEGILYPLLALIAIVLLIWGVLSAWRSEELAGVRKAELKREIILELRRQMRGMTGDELARAVGLAPLTTVKLLEELQKDNILMSHTNTQRLTIWRVLGLPTGTGKKL